MREELLSYLSHGLNSSVIAKLPNGDVASGHVAWLNNESMQVELDTSLVPTDCIEMRVALLGMDETVYMQTAVARSRPAKTNGMAASIVRIIDMPLEDQQLLQRWVEDRSVGGTCSNPGSLLSLSSTRRGGGRSAVLNGLRAGLRLKS